MLAFSLFISLIFAIPVGIDTTAPVAPSPCESSAILTTTVQIMGGRSVTTYCPEYDPDCPNTLVVSSEAGLPCFSDCMYHQGDIWCWVNAAQTVWSFCALDYAHECPQTCGSAFEAGQTCAEGYFRDWTMTNETCSEESPPSGSCHFDTNYQHMDRCCLDPPTTTPSVSPTITPTTDSPSSLPSLTPTTTSPSEQPTPSLPTTSPTTSAPTPGPSISSPSASPSIDCSQFDEDKDGCLENQSMGCVYSLTEGTCAHACPQRPGLSPPGDWLETALMLEEFNNSDSSLCDSQCRYNASCSVYVYIETYASCSLYDTYMPDKEILVERNATLTGFCHETMSPTVSPTASLPSVSPSCQPTKVPSATPSSTSPSMTPTENPSASLPSASPSMTSPSQNPVVSPTGAPVLSSDPSASPTQNPVISTLCKFAGTKKEHCDIYCTDLCYNTPECKEYEPESQPSILRLRHPHAVGFFESHLPAAPATYDSRSHGWVNEGLCTCSTRSQKPLPGMESSACVMHEEELAIEEDDKIWGVEEEVWWAIAACVFLFCCIIPLFFFLCRDQEKDDQYDIMLDDNKPPAVPGAPYNRP